MSESQGIYISIYSSGFPCSLGPKNQIEVAKRRGKTWSRLAGTSNDSGKKKTTEKEGPHKQVRRLRPRWCEKATTAKKNGSGRGTTSVDKRTMISLEAKVNNGLLPFTGTIERQQYFFLQRTVLSFCFYPTGCVPDPTLGGPSDERYIRVSKKGKNAWTLFYRSDRCMTFFYQQSTFPSANCSDLPLGPTSSRATGQWLQAGSN
jgi:hypothetical protein